MEYNRLTKPKGHIDDEVRRRHFEIERGLERRDQEDPEWSHNEKYEDLQQWADTSGNDLSGINSPGTSDIVQRAGTGDEVTINKVGAYVKTHMSAVVPRNPTARVRPKTADGYEPMQVPLLDGDGTPRMGEDGGVMVREVTRYQAREDMINDIIGAPKFGMRKTNERVVKSGDIGYGAVKVGYRPQFNTPRDPEGKQTIPIAEDGSFDMSEYARDKTVGRLVTNDKGDRLIKKSDMPAWDDWFVDWVSYRRLIIDPECENDSRGMRWIVEEEYAVLDDVKEDPLYKNTDDLEATAYRDRKEDVDDLTRATEWNESAYQDDKTKRVLLFHFWDLVEKKYIVMADGHGEALRDGPLPKGVFDHPYAFYRPTEILGEWLPRPRVSDLAPINDAFNLFYQKWLRAAGSSTSKILAWEDSLDPKDMGSLVSDVNNEVVFVKRVGIGMNMGGGLKDRIAAFNTSPMSAAVYAEALKQLDKEFYEVGGIPPEALGTPKSETATQAQMMGAYNTSRMDMDRECLADMWRLAFKKMNDSIDANMTTERAVEMRGSDGQAFVGVVDSDLIYCDCDLDVDVEDMGPDNTAMQMTNRLQMMQVAGQAPHLFETEALVRGWCDPLGIKDPNFIRELAEMSKLQADAIRAQMMAAAMPPGPVPNAGPAGSEADAISQAGAGAQTPRMSRAT